MPVVGYFPRRNSHHFPGILPTKKFPLAPCPIGSFYSSPKGCFFVLPPPAAAENNMRVIRSYTGMAFCNLSSCRLFSAPCNIIGQKPRLSQSRSFKPADLYPATICSKKSRPLGRLFVLYKEIYTEPTPACSRRAQSDNERKSISHEGES